MHIEHRRRSDGGFCLTGELPAWVKRSVITAQDIEEFWLNRRNRCPRMGGRRYDRYLASKSWQLIRCIVFIAAEYRCAECDASAEQVHHLSYERVGRERLSDLLPLCDACHNKRHPDKQGKAVFA